jgi:hypothetical protein
MMPNLVPKTIHNRREPILKLWSDLGVLSLEMIMVQSRQSRENTSKCIHGHANLSREQSFSTPWIREVQVHVALRQTIRSGQNAEIIDEPWQNISGHETRCILLLVKRFIGDA